MIARDPKGDAMTTLAMTMQNDQHFFGDDAEAEIAALRAEIDHTRDDLSRDLNAAYGREQDLREENADLKERIRRLMDYVATELNRSIAAH
jgi:uncharacterized membrane protein